MESKADLILHPVRMRIISTLAGGRELTVQEMLELLTDIPQATLYRHLKKLTEAQIVAVVDEQQVRGAVQRTYTLQEMKSSLGEEDFVSATREDHMRYFTTFVATLLDDFGRYLQQDKFDILADGVGYRQVPLNLTDDELRELSFGMNEILMKYIRNTPGQGRKRRMLSSVIMPVIEPSIE